ncbi:MAG: polysaccharide deacetylase family protein [Candidatus Pacearchaeota archaeon]
MQPKISIHVDGYWGLTKGVPRLLNLFDKYNVKTIFYVNMGREASIFRILRYYFNQIFSKNKKESDLKNTVKRYTKIQMIKTLLLRRKIGCGNPKILNEIEKRGHSVEPHCWSHLEWSRDFEKMDYKKEIEKMKKSFLKCLMREPKSFAPPMWKIDDRTLKELSEQGFETVCILQKDVPNIHAPNGMKLDVLTFEKTVEELLNEGKSEKEILEIYEKEKKRKNAHLYFHADYEGTRGIEIFEKILKIILVKNSNTLI